jgi:hypothetical protein
MSALPSKADIRPRDQDVCFGPQADMQCSRRPRQFANFCQQMAVGLVHKIEIACGSRTGTPAVRKDGDNADPCNNAHTGTKVMTKITLGRRVLLTSQQKAQAAELRAMGFTRSQASRRVLTPEQRQIVNEQIRTAERLRYMENPHREIIRRARNLRNSACRRGAKYNAWKFTITEDDLDWPTHCPVLPWIELHHPGHYRHDPAGASLDRIDREKGYVPANVHVISLRANLLRKDITCEELRALADFFFA